jgi:hypothetical protein
MTEKRNNKRKTSSQSQTSSTWMIIAIIAIVFAVGLVLKIVLFPSGGVSNQSGSVQTVASGASWDSSLDSKEVLLVAARFKCACGGCGELPLDECRCDMPGGAREEKTFIRDKLLEGLNVAQVADLLDKKYGLRVN